MKKKTLLVFHSAIMPYRIDLFNNLSKCFNADFYFLWKTNGNQKMDDSLLFSKLQFEPKFLTKSIKIFNRIVRIDAVRIIRESDVDIIITGEYSLNTFLAFLTKKIFRLKCEIYTICDDSLDMSKNVKGLRSFGRKYLESRLDGIILTNDEVVDYYKTNLKPQKTIAFPIIQDQHFFRKELEQSLLISSRLVKTHNLLGKKVFMFVGRLTFVKNLPFLIKCFKDSIYTNSDSILIFVGDGDQREELEEYVNTLDIRDSVLFVGRHDGLELKAWYNIGQVFVLPSLHEPFGAVTNEALLSGQYVLCSSIAGSSCLIDSDNGALFSHNNANELIDFLIEYNKKIIPLKSVIVRPSKMNISFIESFNKLHKFLDN